MPDDTSLVRRAGSGRTLIELAASVGHGTPTAVRSGSVLTTEGTPGRDAFLVVEGTARVTKDGRLVGSVGAGEFVGELALIDHGPRLATVVATSSLRVLTFDVHRFSALLADPLVSRELQRQVVARLRSSLESVSTNQPTNQRSNQPQGEPVMKKHSDPKRSIVRRVGKRTLFLLCLMVPVAAVTGVAAASIPSTGGVIKGCYDPRSAYVRVVDPALGQTCSSSERALDWNQTGPAGPAGPAGPQGPAGPAGGFQTVARAQACAGTCSYDYYGTYLEAWAGCPAGQTLVGGGFEVVPGRYSNGTVPQFQVRRSMPVPGYNYWVATVTVPSLSYVDLKAYAICIAK